MNTLAWNRRQMVLLVLAAALLLSVLLLAGTVLATPSSGVTGVAVANGVLREPVRAKFKHGEGGFASGADVTNLLLIKYTVEPGGTFGWHRHGGPVWAIVTSGTLTIYSSDDPTCSPQTYSAGQAFLDPGDHTHSGVNETGQPVEVYATFMLPAGGQTRLDAPDPGVCN